MVEVDARRSRDDTAVLLHDPLLLRVQKVPLPVRWAPDRSVGAPRRPDPGRRARGGAHRRRAGRHRHQGPRRGRAVLVAVRAAGAEARVLPWSQHMPVVRAFVRALPDAEVALLRDTFDPAGHDRFLADAAAIGARAVSAHQDAATPAFIAAATERGLAVYRGTSAPTCSGSVSSTWSGAGSPGSSPTGPPRRMRRSPGRSSLRASRADEALVRRRAHRSEGAIFMCAQCVSKADVVIGSIGFAGFVFKGPCEDALVAMGLHPGAAPARGRGAHGQLPA